jgi:hypothetical protein
LSQALLFPGRRSVLYAITSGPVLKTSLVKLCHGAWESISQFVFCFSPRRNGDNSRMHRVGELEEPRQAAGLRHPAIWAASPKVSGRNVGLG